MFEAVGAVIAAVLKIGVPFCVAALIATFPAAIPA